MYRRKRKEYQDAAIQAAISSVAKGEHNVTQAAEYFMVPRQTLADKIHKKHTGKYGRKTALSMDDKKALEGYIMYMASIGHPLNVSNVKIFAWSVGKRSSNPACFGENGPSHRWWRGFKKRHPKLTLRNPDSFDRRRKGMSKKSVMDKHFDLLKATLTEHGLLDQPTKIFNVDESGMELDPVGGKVVVDRTAKHSYKETNGRREHITVNVCCSASGQVLPPMIIFEKCFPSGHYSQFGPDDCLYAKSPNGYMDGELFKKWFTEIFLPQTAHLRPALLMLDGHGSHLTIDLIDLAREHNVILYCLPPHTTHLLQPLDVAVFKALKSYFAKICGQVKLATLGTPKVINVNRTNFTAIFREAFERTMCMLTIKNGFRKCGVHPLSAQSIDWSKVFDDSAIETPAGTQHSDDQLPSAETQTSGERLPATDPSAQLRRHPLLENNIIPQRLVDALIIPHESYSKKPSVRTRTTARVLTSNEHRALVKNKIDADENKRIAAEMRKRKRDERLGKVAVKLPEKRKEETPRVRASGRLSSQQKRNYAKYAKAISSSSDSSSDSHYDSDHVDMDACAKCHKESPAGNSKRIQWICCDTCDSWYHKECEKATETDYNKDYTCKVCLGRS